MVAWPVPYSFHDWYIQKRFEHPPPCDPETLILYCRARAATYNMFGWLRRESSSAVSCLPKILVILYTTSIAAQGDPTQPLSLLPPNVTLTKSTFGAEQWLNIAEGGKGFEMVIECSELNQSSKKGEGAIPNILPNSKQNILSKENCWHMCAIACNYSLFLQSMQSINLPPRSIECWIQNWIVYFGLSLSFF